MGSIWIGDQLTIQLSNLSCNQKYYKILGAENNGASNTCSWVKETSNFHTVLYILCVLHMDNEYNVDQIIFAGWQI